MIKIAYESPELELVRFESAEDVTLSSVDASGIKKEDNDYNITQNDWS